MGLLRISVRGIGLVSTVILARLLVPADFGIVAMAMSILAFLELATAFSFDIPLIQKQDADRNDFDSAWTLNLAFYAGLTILLVLLAQPAADFYQESRLVSVIQVLAIGFFVQGFENIGVVLFRKELDFRKDFVLLISKKLIGFCITVPLAFMLRSYWALIAGMVVSNVLGVLLTYLLHPFRPRFSLRAAGELMNFSKWLVINNALGFLRMRSPTFVIGRLSGTSSLGIFTVAFELATLPTTELVAPINRVVFPAYSKLSNDLAALSKGYLDVLAVIALVALPAGFGLSSISEPLIALVLGSKWASAAPLVAVLAIYGGINAIQTNTGSVYNAIGKPYLITLIGSISVSVLVTASILSAIHYGPIGVSFAYLATSSIMAPISFYIVSRYIGIQFRSILAVLWRPLFASILMFGLLARLSSTLDADTQLRPFQVLGILLPLGALIYIVAVVLLWAASGRPQSAEYRLAMLALRKIGRAKATS